jgi:uncharacterized membrane protein
MMVKTNSQFIAANTPVITGTGGRRMTAPATRRLDWRKRMSDTVAYALLIYTALQILVTMHALSQNNASMLPLFGLVVLVAAIIPLFRHYERHWEGLDDVAAADPSRKPLFRRDQLSVWLFAIGLPFAVTGLFKAIVPLLG